MNRIFINFIILFFINQPINIGGKYNDLKIKRWRCEDRII